MLFSLAGNALFLDFNLIEAFQLWAHIDATANKTTLQFISCVVISIKNECVHGNIIGWSSPRSAMLATSVVFYHCFITFPLPTEMTVYHFYCINFWKIDPQQCWIGIISIILITKISMWSICGHEHVYLIFLAIQQILGICFGCLISIVPSVVV